MDYKKAYDSVRKEVLYNVLIHFGVAIKLVRLINMYCNEMYIKVHVCKCLSDNFPVHMGLKQGYALSPLLSNFVLEYAIRKVQENRVDGN
jgi:hypothetical protein